MMMMKMMMRDRQTNRDTERHREREREREDKDDLVQFKARVVVYCCSFKLIISYRRQQEWSSHSASPAIIA